MQVSRHKTIGTMSTTEMLSLWWEERWVRYLVFSIAPVGFIDAIYTLLLWNTYGAAYEYNPLVRLALSSGWWYLWFITDIVSFLLFTMVAGSYYLHTRSAIFGTHTGWLAALVAFRIGAATYNVLVFYQVLFSLFGASLCALASFIGLRHLLKRTDDISREGLRSYMKLRYLRFKERFITRGIRPVGSSAPEIPRVAQPAEGVQDGYSVWLKRAGYLSGAVIVFVSLPFFLAALVDMLDFGWFNEWFGGLVVWNQQSGLMFVSAFLAVIAFTAGIIYFILKAFAVEEGAW